MAVRKTAKGLALKRWFKERNGKMKKATLVVLQRTRALRSVDHLRE